MLTVSLSVSFYVPYICSLQPITSTLYIVGDVMLGLLIDWDDNLLALPSDQRWSHQEIVELTRIIRCWNLCLVNTSNETTSTEFELW